MHELEVTQFSFLIYHSNLEHYMLCFDALMSNQNYNLVYSAIYFKQTNDFGKVE